MAFKLLVIQERSSIEHQNSCNPIKLIGNWTLKFGKSSKLEIGLELKIGIKIQTSICRSGKWKIGIKF